MSQGIPEMRPLPGAGFNLPHGTIHSAVAEVCPFHG